jgi:hypothetical protein
MELMEAVKNNSYGIRATIKKWFYHNIVWWYNRNLSPFWFCQDDYRGGIQTLYVWRFGQLMIEHWDWGPNNDHSFYYGLQDKGASKSELYNRVKFGAKKFN